eukprot:tig00021608_g22835.t1
MASALLAGSSIAVIAEANGLPGLGEDITTALASDVEYRLREIVQEAMKIMKHSKRAVLTPDDFNSALRLRNVEPVYGWNTCGDTARFKRVAGTNDLFVIEDAELDLNDVINAPLPVCPREMTLAAHWLAVEGVQPSIPQNPAPSQQDGPASAFVTSKKRKPEAPAAGGAAAGSSGAAGGAAGADIGPVTIKPLVKHILSRELQVFFEKATAAIMAESGLAPLPPEDGAVEAPGEVGVPTEEEALQALSRDAGLHQLVPYFAQFVSYEVSRNLRNLRLLRSLMRLVRALLSNPHIHIEPYLHQLMPAILTCLVGKRLCNSPAENHWSLRDYAAGLVALICERYGAAYRTLVPRITRTLVAALLDFGKPLTTHYGAIIGLAHLGPHVLHSILMPNVPAYMRILAAEVPEATEADPRRASPAPRAGSTAGAAEGEGENEAERAAAAAAAAHAAELRRFVKRFEAGKVHSALLAAAGTYLHKYMEALPQQPQQQRAGQQLTLGDLVQQQQQRGEGAGGPGRPGVAPEEPGALLPKLAVPYGALSEHFGEGLLPYVRQDARLFPALGALGDLFI